jgi:hypothetical protein
MRRLLISLAGMALIGAAKPEPDWRPLDPANTLVIETTRGRIVVEMAPMLAPLAVVRVKRLAREGVYDGLQFHRVIEGFVDQTGNPNNHDGGTSAYPDLPAEFAARLPAEAGPVIVQTRSDGIEGFLGSVPIAGVSPTEQGLTIGCAPGAPTARASPAWAARRGSTRPTARSSSCVRRRDGLTTTMRSGARSFRGWTSFAPSRSANLRRIRTAC